MSTSWSIRSLRPERGQYWANISLLEKFTVGLLEKFTVSLLEKFNIGLLGKFTVKIR